MEAHSRINLHCHESTFKVNFNEGSERKEKCYSRSFNLLRKYLNSPKQNDDKIYGQ